MKPTRVALSHSWFDLHRPNSVARYSTSAKPIPNGLNRCVVNNVAMVKIKSHGVWVPGFHQRAAVPLCGLISLPPNWTWCWSTSYMIFSLKPRGTEPLISESNSSAELSSKPKPTSIRKMSGNESNKAKATPNSPHSLQFVNISANGTSEEERHRHQRMVRSAAMKSFRREQKSKQDGKKGKSGSRSSTATPSDTDPSKASIRRVTFPDIPPVSSAEQTESSSPSDGVVSERSWPTGVSPVFGELDINSVDLSMHPHTEQSTALVVPQSSPTFSYLGAGRGDPFQLYTENAGSHAGELIDHCKSKSTSIPRLRISHSISWKFLTCSSHSFVYPMAWLPSPYLSR